MDRWGLILSTLTIVTMLFIYQNGEDKEEKSYAEQIFQLRLDKIVDKMESRIDKEIESLRDLLREHILLSGKQEQLEPLKLDKRRNAVEDGVSCLVGNIGSCIDALDDVL